MNPDRADIDLDATLEACAAGDREALSRLYDAEGGRLLGCALRIVHDRQTAEDVLQDALIQIWKYAPSFDRRLGSARGWITTAVRHRAIHHVRQRRRIEPVDDIDARVEAAGAHDAVTAHQADDALAATDPARARDLDRCLETLDDVSRECIVLAFVEGLSHRELAQRVDAPLGTVKSRVRRGLALLRKCLS